jgi:hypothetical protein
MQEWTVPWGPTYWLTDMTVLKITLKTNTKQNVSFMGYAVHTTPTTYMSTVSGDWSSVSRSICMECML